MDPVTAAGRQSFYFGHNACRLQYLARTHLVYSLKFTLNVPYTYDYIAGRLTHTPPGVKFDIWLSHDYHISNNTSSTYASVNCSCTVHIYIKCTISTCVRVCACACVRMCVRSFLLRLLYMESTVARYSNARGTGKYMRFGYLNLKIVSYYNLYKLTKVH